MANTAVGARKLSHADRRKVVAAQKMRMIV
jgi:hypothetical protein